MKTKWLVIVLVGFWIAGYFREYFFVHLNYIMFEKYYGHASFPPPAVMRPFTQFSYTTLYYTKYLATALSVAVFFLLNYFALAVLTQEKKLKRFLVYTYLVLLFLAAGSMAWGYFVNGRLQDDEYTLSRWLMGIAQSPLIFLILLASEKLYYKSFHS